MDPFPAAHQDPAPARRFPPVAFGLVALGALVAGIGSLQTWLTVIVPEAPVLNRIYKGIDLTEGKIVLGAALLLLVGIAALSRLRAPGPARTIITMDVLIVALAIIGAAVVVLATAHDTYVTYQGDTQEFGIGVYLSITGGAMAVIGAIIALRWSLSARTLAAETTPVEDDPGQGTPGPTVPGTLA
jgi:hypothetical protein